MKRFFLYSYILTILVSSQICFGQNSLPTSGPVVINNTLTVSGGTAFGSTVGMANNYFLYWNDAAGTARRIIGVASTNSVHIGDIDNVLNGSNIYQTKNNHSFYNNGNYTFGINNIGQTYFANNVWHASIDGKRRFYYALNSTTYFGTNNSYVFRNSADIDMAFLTPQGNMSVAANQTGGSSYLEVGTGKTGNGNSYIDLVGDATYYDYGLRLIRANGGADTDSYLQNRGTGILNIEAVDAGGVALKTNGSNRFFINSSGNVGVGTTSPNSKFQIDVATQNGSPTTALRLSAVGTSWANTGAALEFYNQDNGGVNLGAKIASLLQDGGANAQKTDLAFYTTLSGTNNEKMRITSAGNIGIGSTIPQSKLHVGVTQRTASGDQNADIISSNGLIVGSGKMLSLDQNYFTHASMVFNTSVGNEARFVHQGYYGHAFTTRGDTPRMIILGGTGQVLIGTSTPYLDYKLAVAGNVIADKVKVKKSSNGIWPDFVFAPNYKLTTLSEVESFVKQNSHLPEIPSAAEIEKDGQDLG